jgi:hypothetical protein
MPSDTFSLKRFLRLVKADLALNTEWILPGAAVFFWVMTVGSFFKGFLTGDSPVAPGFYLCMMFLGGFFLTSLSFAELGDLRKTRAYLLLPCSAIEKYLSRYLLTSWFYVAASLLAYSAFIFFAGALYSIIKAQPFSFSACFNPANVRYLFDYLLIHPVFLAGAVYFKRQTFLKTMVVILALPAALMGFRMLWDRILYYNSIFHPDHYDVFFNIFSVYFKDLRNVICVVSSWPFPALPPFLLIIGYLRLKERESVDGI